MSETRRRLVLLLTVLVVFAVSSNIAWLNPWPEKESFRGIESIPFMWQYNQASGVEILSAAYFPETYRTYTDRINRPTYPLAVYLIGNAIGLVASPVADLSPLERAGAGYIVLKLLVFSLAALAMYDLLTRWLARDVAAFATLLMLLHAHSIEFAAGFHTTELQVLTPIFVLWLFFRVTDRWGERSHGAPRIRRLGGLAGASVVVGVLMLAKQNYAVYLALILFALYKREWGAVVVSVVAHLLPLAAYLLFLRAVDIPYVNHEAATYDQGTWVLDLFRQNPIQSLGQVIDSLWRSLVHLTGFFSVWLLLAVAALARIRSLRVDRDLLVGMGLFFFATWLQIFAANRYYDYMVSDVAIVVFALGAWMLFELVQFLPQRLTGVVTKGVLLLWFVGNVLSFVHFPWIHPFDQPARNTEVLDNRLEMVENPDAFTDEDRARAQGGVIVEPGAIKSVPPDEEQQ